MRKNLLQSFKDYLANRSTKSLARCWKITLTDDTIYGYTSHTRDLTFLGDSYQTVLGLQSSAVKSTEGLNVDNLVVSAFLSTQNELDILSGKFDNAKLEVFIVDYYDLTKEKLVEKVGYLGEITRQDGMFEAEIRGLADLLQTKVGQVYSSTCRVARLGDSRCKVTVTAIQQYVYVSFVAGSNTIVRQGAAPVGSFITEGFVAGRTLTISGTASNNGSTTITLVGATTLTVSGSLTNESNITALLTQSSPFAGTGEVTTVTSRRKFNASGLSGFTNGWFTRGIMKFTTGANVDIERDVRFHDGTLIEVFLEFPFNIAIGDDFTIEAGCDRQRLTCKDKFSNLDNFRGEPFIPVVEEVFDTSINTGQTIINAV